jgi:DNA-binding NarL/FixJ family response regulator
VLLVSDLRLFRAGLCCLFREAGILLVGEAEDCESAVAISQNHQPHVIVLDLDLPQRGFNCFDDLIAASADSRILAIADPRRLSEHLSPIELGAVGLVMKDQSADIFIKAIRKVHAGEVWLERRDTAGALRRIARRRRVEDEETAKIARLTKREHEILNLIGEGLKNHTIASRLFISEATVRNHVTSILDKLDVSDRFELVVYAFRHGLIDYSHTTRSLRPPKHSH